MPREALGALKGQWRHELAVTELDFEHQFRSLVQGSILESQPIYGYEEHVSHDGRVYFKYGHFLTPCNIKDLAVNVAFKQAQIQINRCLKAHNVSLGSHEVVVVLHSLSLLELHFYYYVVDHQYGRIVDTFAHSGSVPGVENVGIYDGPTQSEAEYWRHVAIFPAHRPCTPRAYDDACSLVRQSVKKSFVKFADVPHPERELALHHLLSRFDRDNIDIHATFSVARAMLDVFDAASKECLPIETPARPTLMQSLMGLFTGVFGTIGHEGEVTNAGNAHVRRAPPESNPGLVISGVSHRV